VAGNIDWVFLRADPALAFSWLKYARGLPENDPELIKARNNLVRSRLMDRVLRRENPGGSWDRPESPYLPKYKSTYWQFILLGHLGALVELARVKRAAGFIQGLQEADGFWPSESRGVGLEKKGEPSLWVTLKATETLRRLGI